VLGGDFEHGHDGDVARRSRQVPKPGGAACVILIASAIVFCASASSSAPPPTFLGRQCAAVHDVLVLAVLAWLSLRGGGELVVPAEQAIR
jgi:hypothetical protein